MELLHIKKIPIHINPESIIRGRNWLYSSRLQDNSLVVCITAFIYHLTLEFIQLFVDYLSFIYCRLHQNLKPAMNTLSVKDFFNIVDVIFTAQPSLPSNLQKRLQAIYPKLQVWLVSVSN
jgi:hypothetical protein